MTRFVPVTVLVVLVAASGVARAEPVGTTLPNGAVLTFEKLFIQRNGTAFEEPQTPDERRRYFNLAHCICGQASPDTPGAKFQYRLTLTGTTNTHRPAELWVGTSCNDNMLRGTMCRKLDAPTLSDIDAVANADTRLTFSLYDVVLGMAKTGNCPPDETDKPIFLLADTDTTAGIDYGLVQNTGQVAGDTAVGVDTKPPPPPESLVGTASENAIVLSWKAPTSRGNDIFAYQALCSETTGAAASTNPPQPLFRDTFRTCGIPSEETLLVASDGGTRGSIPLPDELVTLQPDRICGEVQSPTATSMTLGGLKNGTEYNVLLLAIDLHGNYAGTYLVETVTPHLVTDFWEDLHDRGSDAEGGLCLMAETYGGDSALTNMLRAFRDDTLGASRLGRWLGDAYYATLGRLGVHVHGSIALRVIAAVLLAPIVALALLWHWLGLPVLLGLLAAVWWLRRRRAARPSRRWAWLRAPAVVGVAVIVLGAGEANAGGGAYQPYWEDNDFADPSRSQDVVPGDPSLVEWHVGIRVGPYVPDIDNQLDTHPGPYEQMFPETRVLPMLDVDRILWTGFGQIGIGGSLGYLQTTHTAFVMGSDPNDPNRPRDPGARNTFRLIPFALTATYRFTLLDDNYGVPVVPYVRGGLSYYVWWIKAPNGGYARVCKDLAMPCTGDNENKALGASLGLQGSIGLAIRAERIDASAARSRQASGIQHAGIYAELSAAQVDGFGSEKKLSVGDRTWFAGVDFEF